MNIYFFVLKKKIVCFLWVYKKGISAINVSSIWKKSTINWTLMYAMLQYLRRFTCQM